MNIRNKRHQDEIKKVSLISLGSLKYPVDVSYLKNWKSSIFKVSHDASIVHLPNAEGSGWEYPNSQLEGLFHHDHSADLTVALITAPLEGNYYMRRLNANVAVLSLAEMADIVRYSNFTVENYILRNIYELAVLYVANGNLIPHDVYTGRMMTCADAYLT